MKAYILKDADLERLRDIIANRAIHLLEKGDAEQHRKQAREQYQALVDRWIEGIKQ